MTNEEDFQQENSGQEQRNTARQSILLVAQMTGTDSDRIPSKG